MKLFLSGLKFLVQHQYPGQPGTKELHMARYHRLNLMEREELSRMLAVGYSLRATAQVLVRAPSTLSRELARHRTCPLTYRAVPAHQRAPRRAHQRRKPRKLAVQPRLRAAVFRLLAQRWSPEQIAHGLLQRYPDDPTMRISHEAIYTYLYVLPRGALSVNLPGICGGATVFVGLARADSRRARSRTS